MTTEPFGGGDVAALIQSFASVLRAAAGQTLVLRIDLEGAMARRSLDTTQFKAALLNLVLNARETHARRTELTVSADVVDLADDADVTPQLVPGRYAAIAVTDRGISPDASAPTIGSVVDDSELPRHRIGLGLSQVYGFAAQSGGGIGTTSADGLGSSVTIYLPLHERTDVTTAVVHETIVSESNP